MHIMFEVIAVLGVASAVFAGGCGSEPTKASDPSGPEMARLGSGVSVDEFVRLPSDTLLQLLKTRTYLHTDNLDSAIRYLTKRQCGIDATQASWIDDTPIDAIYDTTAVLGARVVNGCGMLILGDHSATCGPVSINRKACFERSPLPSGAK
jgi:hypothetical protein